MDKPRRLLVQTLAKGLVLLLGLGFFFGQGSRLFAQDDDPGVLNQQVVELYQQGKYREAIPIAETLLAIEKQALGPDDPDVATVLNDLALLYKATGAYREAESRYQQALQIYQKALGSQHPYTVTGLNNLAALYQTMGAYDKAEPLLVQALQIRQKELGPDHPDTAVSLNNLAVHYHAMGVYDKAEALYRQALQIDQKAPGPEHPEVVTDLNNLAALYHDMGAYDKAEPLYRQALQITRKAPGPEHLEVATVLNNLATLYHDMGAYDKAEALFEQALQIDQKALGSEHPEVATDLNNLALLCEGTGAYDKAEALYRQALQINQKALGPEHPHTAVILRNLAFLKFDCGELAAAKALAQQSDQARLALLSKVLSFTSEQQRLAYQATLNPYTLFALLDGSEAELALAVLRYKGVVLDSIVEDHLLAETSQGSEDQKLVEQLNLDKRQLDQLLLKPAQEISNETNQKKEALEREVEKIEGQLAQHVAGLGQARHALGVSLEQVQPTIPNDGALIEYLRYWHYSGKGKWEARYGAIVLFSKGAPLWIQLGKANEIETLVRRYGTLVRGSSEDEELSANLQALYEALWAPIGQALPSQTKRIIISPDGELNFISFATLLTEDNQFLAQRYSIQYVATGRDLLRQVKPSAAKEVVLFANPIFDLASTEMLAKPDNRTADAGSIRGDEKTAIEDWSFGSLAGTQKERDALIKKFAGWDWKPSDFTANKATKEALLKIHSPYILHLATHGFFAKEDPSIATAGSEQLLSIQQRVTKSKFFKNPMHRSGLALAGAQTTIEAWKRGEVPPIENDGILTAEDVSTLDLKATWLVTLSACDTGSGEARAGEGVMGLRRGFIQAGTQNLLMTLWPISDEVTVQIMSDFYEAAHNSGNAPEALAEVQREWLLKQRTEKGLAQAVNLAGPFIMSSQGKP
jgi:CHAT domain-containing protein/Tfp pilus assembly protein PilF